MLASFSSQHVESEISRFGNPKSDSTKPHYALGAALHRLGISIGVDIGTRSNVIEALGQRVHPSDRLPIGQNVIAIEGGRR
jgi:hypothetical protein